MRRRVWLLVLLLIGVGEAPAQTSATVAADSTPAALSVDTTPTIKLQSNLVAVSAIARDKDGKPLSGLIRPEGRWEAAAHHVFLAGLRSAANAGVDGGHERQPAWLHRR